MINSIQLIHPNGTVYANLYWADGMFLHPGWHRLPSGRFKIPNYDPIEPPWILQGRRGQEGWVTLDQNVGGAS